LYSINCIADALSDPGDTVLWSKTPNTLSVKLRPPESAVCPWKLLSNVTLSILTFGHVVELQVPAAAKGAEIALELSVRIFMQEMRDVEELKVG
jgi:hypothetical protein